MSGDKRDALLHYLRSLGSCAVAYSGGVDSTFLLACAAQALGDRAVGVIGRSPTYPRREFDSAVALAKDIGARIEIIDTDELSNPAFFTNPPTRCFACKTTLFSGVWQVAEALGLAYVLEGSNHDDLGDYRPGMDAARRQKVKAPLVDLAFTKEEIRAYSRQMGLPTWDKPAMACLSSRIPYGETITPERLSRVERAEYALADMGFYGARVRDYGDLCRIEVRPDRRSELASGPVADQVVRALKEVGYRFVTMDLEGYRTGSMNRVLPQVRASKGAATNQERNT